MLIRQCFRLLFLGLIVFGINWVSVQDTHAGAPLDADTVTEDSLSYNSGFYVLDNIEHEPYPFGSFAIYVDRNGTGHVQSHAVKPRDPDAPPKKKTPFADCVIQDWTERTSFKKKGQGWIQLSLTEAKRLWGEPRKYIVRGKDFYTFDAHSTFNREENLYHLDLMFDSNEIINAYRVRGIGIRDPQWVCSDSSSIPFSRIGRSTKGSLNTGSNSEKEPDSKTK